MHIENIILLSVFLMCKYWISMFKNMELGLDLVICICCITRVQVG